MKAKNDDRPGKNVICNTILAIRSGMEHNTDQEIGKAEFG